MCLLPIWFVCRPSVRIPAAKEAEDVVDGIGGVSQPRPVLQFSSVVLESLCVESACAAWALLSQTHASVDSSLAE